MASGGIGSIAVMLGLDAAEFVSGLQRSEREAARASKRIEKEMSTAANAIKAGFAGITLGVTIQKFIRETVDAQNEAAQLKAVLRSTGEAAGYTQEKLNAMAMELSQSSIFSDGDITQAQTRLLSYTGVVGEQFPAAMQAAIDMATRMGMDVTSAAEAVGKALDIPSQGLTALTKQGFRFTEEEKKLVEALEKAGRTAEAQDIVLRQLQNSYGGAAKEARDTLGGALAALKNEFDNLMTGEGGNVESTRAAIENLTKTLGSAETKEAFASATQALATLVGWAVDGTNAFLGFGKQVGESLARGFHGSATPADDRVKQLEVEARNLQFSIEMAQKASDSGREQRLANLRAQAGRVDAELQTLISRYTLTVRPDAPSTGGSGTGKPKAPPPTGGDKQQASEAQRYLESLQKQLQSARELTTVQKLQDDLLAGRLKLTGDVSRQQLEAVAQQIDSEKKLKELREKDKDLEKLAREYSEAVEYNNTLLEAELGLIGQKDEQKSLALDQLRIELDLEKKIADIKRMGGTDEATEKAIADVRTAANREKAGRQARKFIEEQEKIAADAQKVWENFTENVQRNLGDGLYNAMQGNFDNIGDAFLSMLQRMVADAMAANIMKALLGSTGSGLLGSLFNIGMSAFGGAGTTAATTAASTGASFGSLGSGFYGMSFAVGSDYVPRDMIAKIHKGERILTAEENRNFNLTSAKPSLTYAPVIQIDSRSDRDAINKDVQRQIRQGNAEFAERLTRAGVI